MRLFILLLFIGFSTLVFGQNVERQGNKLIAKTEVKAIDLSKCEKTADVYVAKDKKEYPVYRSSRGTLFIIRTSKNGNQYKFYIKE